MLIDFDEATGTQQYRGPRVLEIKDLIYVCVALHAPEDGERDRFFVLTQADIQAACIASYAAWMDPKSWRRPLRPARGFAPA